MDGTLQGARLAAGSLRLDEEGTTVPYEDTVRHAIG